MSAWGERAFDNDTACDWAYGLENVSDLSLVKASLEAVEQVGNEYLDADTAIEALAACEVIARLLGRPGHQDAYTETVDQWVAAHPMQPPAELVRRALAISERILGTDSELRDLWDEEYQAEWVAAVRELQQRLAAQ